MEPLIKKFPFKFFFFKIIHKICFVKQYAINKNSERGLEFLLLNKNFYNHENVLVIEYKEISQKIEYFEIFIYFICGFITFFSWKLWEYKFDMSIISNLKETKKQKLVFMFSWVIFTKKNLSFIFSF